MKKLILTSAFYLLLVSALTQDTATKKSTSQNPISLQVPDFADPEIKKFYAAYSNHLAKCVEAIREKNEAKVTALLKSGGTIGCPWKNCRKTGNKKCCRKTKIHGVCSAGIPINKTGIPIYKRSGAINVLSKDVWEKRKE